MTNTNPDNLDNETIEFWPRARYNEYSTVDYSSGRLVLKHSGKWAVYASVVLGLGLGMALIFHYIFSGWFPGEVIIAIVAVALLVMGLLQNMGITFDSTTRTITESSLLGLKKTVIHSDQIQAIQCRDGNWARLTLVYSSGKLFRTGVACEANFKSAMGVVELAWWCAGWLKVPLMIDNDVVGDIATPRELIDLLKKIAQE